MNEDELEGLAALFFEHEWKPAVRIRGYLWKFVRRSFQTCFSSFLFARSVARAVIELITQVAAISACENKSGRYQCFFNRFNPVWCGSGGRGQLACAAMGMHGR